MIIASGTQFLVYLSWGQRPFSIVSYNSVLNVKALVGAFNQEKALIGAFSVIVKTDCGLIVLQHCTLHILHHTCSSLTFSLTILSDKIQRLLNFCSPAPVPTEWKVQLK